MRNLALLENIYPCLQMNLFAGQEEKCRRTEQRCTDTGEEVGGLTNGENGIDIYMPPGVKQIVSGLPRCLRW